MTDNQQTPANKQTKSNKKAKIDNDTLKLLKGIGHQLKPIVMIGGNGLTQSIIDEIDRALTDHELIKIKLPAGSKEERQAFASEITTNTKSQLIHTVGRMALILRKNPNANPRLSNLVRYTY